MTFIFLQFVSLLSFAADSEVRCGKVVLSKSNDVELKDCMIARPRFDEIYKGDAGWNICVLTGKELETNRKRILDSEGKQICVQGRHEGLGQFRFERIIPWRSRYEAK